VPGELLGILQRATGRNDLLGQAGDERPLPALSNVDRPVFVGFCRLATTVLKP